MYTRYIFIIIFSTLILKNVIGQTEINILIAYYSKTGNTKTMAEAVAEGANLDEQVNVKLLQVSQVKTADLLIADAIIVGTPVYNANVSSPVLEFISKWPFKDSPLKDKIGAAFVTAGGISAGEELAQLNILHAMLIFEMIIVGGPHWNQAFGASAIVEEEPFVITDPDKTIDPRFLKKGKALGKRVAQVAFRLRAGKKNNSD